jgi:dienelactone hydrolase
MEYAPGRLADIFGDPTQPTVLLWHGMQTNARTAFRPLAGLLADRGAAVVAPDWNSHAADGGRADLLRSLEFTQRRTNDSLVLVGWSLGGVAAARVTLDAADFNVALSHTVCLSGAFMAPDPISGRLVTDGLSGERGGPPFTLLHGLADDVVPVTASRDFAAALERIGWPVDVVELAGDHGTIAGADYDPVADRYQPGRSDQAQAMAGQVAALIAAKIDL